MTPSKVFVAFATVVACQLVALVIAGIPPAPVPTPAPACEKCPKNEVYSECGNNGCQNTCAKPDFASVCRGICTPGCICAEGYLRNSKGVCVLPEKCEKCPKNEVYSECGNNGCQNTCAKPDFASVCRGICTPGCICAEGYLRNSKGVCVLPEKCVTCPKYEVYSECGNNACQNTCANPNIAPVCKATCVSGCICAEGYLRNSKGVCVIPENCDTCKVNEIFSKCNNVGCQNTCAEPDLITRCDYVAGCYPGCICKPGFLRDPSGNCICESLCMCGENEQYSESGKTICANTCADPQKSTKCKAKAEPGCGCKEGYLRNNEGSCVLPENCGICKVNEIFSECDNHGCQNTCAEPNLITRCTYLPGCYPGCICKPGFLRDPSGNCICESLCMCGENEQYSESGKTICANTCADPQKSTKCKAKAEPGCGCMEGYLRNNEGSCVLPEDCGGCGGDPNAQFSACGDPCPYTCAHPSGPRCLLCLAEGGCACKEGYVKDIHGKCILPSECPKCGPNEVFACGSACDTTCATLGEVCPIVNIRCNDKCYCVDGYARDKNDVCIPIKQCPPKLKCSKNQKYNPCPMACPPEQTCFEYIEGLVYDCAPELETRVCVPKCECQTGFVRQTTNGTCILPETCCEDPNAVVVECPNPCPGGTCDSPKFADCKAPCKFRGCQCKSGYVKDSNGKCIRLSKCPICTTTPSPTTESPAPKCKKPNEEFNECGTNCPATCDNRNPFCTLNCVSGCFCKEGFIRQDGVCIPIEECPERCPGQNEEYSDCGSCAITCENKDTPFACAAVCRQGCFCKQGFVRKDGVCVPPEECPPKCEKPNEEFKECGTNCPATCDNRNPFCTLNCVSGCFCKEGFIRQDGVCIPIEECPERCPGQNEEYSDCGGCAITCENKDTPFACPDVCRQGCFCKQGFVRKDGVCVPPEECPPKCEKPNEEFRQCGTKCPATCDNRNPLCIKICVSGCFCKKGFIRQDGVCIPIEECPLTCDDPNAEVVDCPNLCPGGTCKQPKFSLCPQRPCEGIEDRGCQCKRGYVKDSAGKCILLSQCPSICANPNEEFRECGTVCPATCDNRNPSCTKNCVSGCFCKEGFIRQDGVCIPIEECPFKCEANEVYEKCPSPCPPELSCASMFTGMIPYCPIQLNPAVCIPRCGCKEGYVRNDQKVCVIPEKCCTDPNSELVNNPNCCPGGTCDNPTFSLCPLRCNRKGCQCKKGFLKKNDSDSTCIPVQKCPKPTVCPTTTTKCSTIKPTQATKPSKGSTTKPTQATKPSTCSTTKPTQATKPSTCSTTKPTQATKLPICSTTKPTVCPTTTTKCSTIKPTQATKPSKGSTTKPTQATKPSTCSTTKPTQATKPSTCSTTKPTQVTKPPICSTTKPTVCPTTTKCSTIKPTHATKPSKGSTPKPTQATKPSTCSTTKPTQATKPPTCSTTKPTEATKPSKCSTTKPTLATKPTKCSITQPTRVTKPTKCSTTKPTEATIPSKCSTTKSTQATKPTKCSPAPLKATKSTKLCNSESREFSEPILSKPKPILPKPTNPITSKCPILIIDPPPIDAPVL